MKKVIAISFLLFSLALFSQTETHYSNSFNQHPEWVELMYKESPDAGQVIKAYQDYYKSHPFVKNKHTQYYKRWQRALSRAVAQPTQEYINATLNEKKSSTVWEARGPFDFDIDAASRSYAPGAAHVYCVEQSSSNENIIYAGTATAGLWRSNDKGENWFCLSKSLPINRVYALEIDPDNENIIYFSGGGTLYKSDNGGESHTNIGDGEFNSGIEIKEIMFHNGKLWVASNQGLYYSTNNGNTFSQKMSGTWLETEVHPTDNNVIYAVKENSSSTSFYKSINNGDSFTLFENGWPNPGSNEEQKRTEIAVSPAAPDKIVALATGNANGGSGLYGIYVSEDRGETWEFKCCGDQPGGVPSSSNINMMGWQDDGSDDGGQYYYDLALAVNPNNANIIHVGAVNHWISDDGGETFSCPAKWSHPNKDEYIHADIHDIRYFGNDLWVACDGGVFYSNDAGDNFDKKMYGISGTDFWGFGSGFTDGEVMLGGTYHNGTLIKDNEVYEGGWLCAEGGDNYRGFVNFADDRKVYTDAGGRILSGNRTQELGSFSMQYKPNASYTIGESSNLEFDPRCPNILYIGNETTLYKSYDNGANTTALHDFGEKITSVEVAWSNPDFIYLATFNGWWETKKLYKSMDGGNNWVDITPNSSIINGQDWIPYDITISSENENHLWIVRSSMYGTPSDGVGHDVFKSIDGGGSWTNLSTNTIKDENITNIEHIRGSNGGVYIGTRQAVYYRDNTMNDWVLFNNNLPMQTFSVQLIPYYKEGKLKNGTNQGVWEANFYTENPPSAQIAADKLSIDCTNNTVQFYNHSAMRSEGAEFEWSFPGGIPENSTDENPLIYYSNPGMYDVSLTITDVNGTDTQIQSNFIDFSVLTISDLNEMEESFESSIFPPEGWSLPESAYSWQQIEVTSEANCETGNAVYVENFSIDQSGVEATLMSPKINLELFDNPTLTFNYAYAQYGTNYSDGLKVEVSLDCGSTWTTLWEAYGSNLATQENQSSWWEPECEDWERLNISLSEYTNQFVNIRFINVNGYGNNLFLDNINFINNDGSIDVVNPIPGCMNAEANNFNPEANVDDGTCIFMALGEQIISLNQGWNIFSTYISPSNSAFDAIMTPIVSEITIAKDYAGNSYLPEWEYNSIGDLSNLEGYLIKVNSNCSITLEGELVAPENTPIPIREGWSIISYLRNNDANAELILEPIANDLIIVKNFLGEAFLPQWNYNGIGNFKPGQGYQVKSSSSTELQYISNSSSYRLGQKNNIKNNPSHILLDINTGSNMHIVIPKDAWGLDIENNAEIYAYDAQGKVVGGSKITFPNTVLCLWGNDEYNNEKDGLYDAEEWNLKIWQPQTKTLENIHLNQQNGCFFKKDDLIIAQTISLNESLNELKLFDAIPNPASNKSIIRMYLSEEAEIKLILYNILGGKMITIAEEKMNVGYHKFELNTLALPSGTYFYTLSTNKYQKSKRLEIMKL